MEKVSVIIPFYNRDKTVIRAIESVLNQTYKCFEIILIDDGSDLKYSQNVESFLSSKKHEINIQYVRQENSGPSKARNKGILLAKGNYIAFLDSDDTWLENKIERQVEFMIKYNIDLLGCNLYIDSKNKINKFNFTKETLKKLSFKEMLFKHYISTPAAIAKKSVLLDVGMFPEEQRYAEDIFMFTKIARNHRVYILGENLVTIYKPLFGQDGLSKNIKDTEKCMLLNFKKFRLENKYYDEKISVVLYVIIICFSILKYFRRIIIVNLRKVIK